MAKKKELTLRDVFETINERFNFVATHFKKVDEQFGTVFAQLHALHDNMKELQEGQKQHDGRFDEIEESLEAISKAVDKDAITIISHERRIRSLERARS